MPHGDFHPVLFVIVAVWVLVCGLGVVAFRNVVHSAMSMVLCFLGVAAAYVLLNAGLLAIIQILVYVGAISVVVLFATPPTPPVPPGLVPLVPAVPAVPVTFCAAASRGSAVKPMDSAIRPVPASSAIRRALGLGLSLRPVAITGPATMRAGRSRPRKTASISTDREIVWAGIA